MAPRHRLPTRLATRLAFFASGFGFACWAPLVPYAKRRLAVGDATFGLLLLCISAGSIVAMQFTGPACARHGAKPAIVASGLGVGIMLPFLAIAATPLGLAATLLGFGASLGSLDLAMNVHAVEVERTAHRPLMSGFHALFSVGGFAGSALMTFLLSTYLGPLGSALCSAVIALGAIVLAWPRLLPKTRAKPGPLFAMPRGVVLVISGLTAVAFLIEDALLDWSALLITRSGLEPAARGGIGYMLFAVAMAAGRLSGDAVSARIGDRATLLGSGVLAVVGFIVLLTAPFSLLAMAGFPLIGLGASNIVPLLFRKAGTQKIMPPALAISAMATTGYAGGLVGPVAVGLLAKAVGLHDAFWMLTALLCLVPLTAPFLPQTAARTPPS